MQFTDSDSNNEGDLKKLESIWKHIKQTKQMKTKKNSRKQSIRTVINNVQTPYLTEELIKAKQNINVLLDRLKQASNEIEELKTQINCQGHESDNEQNHQSRSALNLQINELNEIISCKDQQISKNELKIKCQQYEMEKMRNEINNNLRKINDKENQEKNTEQIIKDVTMSHHNTDDLMQIEESSRTIQRLVELLRMTKEYKQFGNFAKEMKHLHLLRKKSTNVMHCKSHTCSCKNTNINERAMWTETQAYKVMLSMKVKYDYLSEDCIDEVLCNLNRIWLIREESRISKLKGNQEIQINKMRKKMEEKYDQVIAKKQIKRLKLQLQNTKRSKSTNLKNNSHKLKNLKSIGQYEDQIKLKDKENRLLHERVQLLQSQTNDCNKQLYLEGALWLAGKIIQQINNNGANLEIISTQFKHCFEKNDEESDIGQFCQEIFKHIHEMHQHLLNKVVDIRESLVEKIYPN